MFRLRNNLGTPCHAPEMMANIRVILFNPIGVILADDMPTTRKHFFHHLAVVGEITRFGMSNLLVELSKRRHITTTKNPGKGSIRCTAKCSPNPELLSFFWIKCHISSNSISGTRGTFWGFGSDNAMSRIHRRAVVRVTLNSFARNPKLAFPLEYNKAARTFASGEALARSSPSIKFVPQALQPKRCFPRTRPLFTRSVDPHFLHFLSMKDMYQGSHESSSRIYL